MYTQVTFEEVREKVEEDSYEVYRCWKESKKGDLYVELRSDGSKTADNSVKQLEMYMKNEDEFDKVQSELA